ncbi:hypothetical protein D3C76_1200430 [compost metagenome]
MSSGTRCPYRIPASNPSAVISTGRSSTTTVSRTSGHLVANSFREGEINCAAASAKTLIRNTPKRPRPGALTVSSAEEIVSNPHESFSAISWPSAVADTDRLVLFSSLAPSRVSSRLMAWLTAEDDRPSSMAASLKLRHRKTVTNA